MIPLRRLARGPIEWEARLPPEDAALSDSGLRFARDPEVRLTLDRSADGGVHAVGTIEAAYRLACRRCLGDVAHEVTLPIDVWFDPAVEDDSGDEAVYAMAGDAVSIDLAPAIRDELILALPEYPVCRRDCMGLCPGCGSDLNREACSCGPRETDPRWDALRAAGGE